MKIVDIEQEKANLETNIAVVQSDIGYIKASLIQMDKKIDTLSSQFVSHQEFAPVRNIVYGAVGLILTMAFIGILSLVFKVSLTVKP